MARLLNPPLPPAPSVPETPFDEVLRTFWNEHSRPAWSISTEVVCVGDHYAIRALVLCSFGYDQPPRSVVTAHSDLVAGRADTEMATQQALRRAFALLPTSTAQMASPARRQSIELVIADRPDGT